MKSLRTNGQGQVDRQTDGWFSFLIVFLQEVKSAEEELFDKLVKETRDILERYIIVQHFKKKVCICVCV